MATLLVIGASQGIGLETVKARSRPAIACARSPAARPRSRSMRQSSRRSPAMRSIRAGVAKAVAGADAVSNRSARRSSAQSVIVATTLFSRATRILIDAMRAAGVRRLVTVTGLGAGDSRGHGGFLYDALLPAGLEARLRRQGRAGADDPRQRPRLDHRPPRPAHERPGDGHGARADRSQGLGAGSISRADVAQFLVREVFERRFVGQTPLLIR